MFNIWTGVSLDLRLTHMHELNDIRHSNDERNELLPSSPLGSVHSFASMRGKALRTTKQSQHQTHGLCTAYIL